MKFGKRLVHLFSGCHITDIPPIIQPDADGYYIQQTLHCGCGKALFTQAWAPGEERAVDESGELSYMRKCYRLIWAPVWMQTRTVSQHFLILETGVS